MKLYISKIELKGILTTDNVTFSFSFFSKNQHFQMSIC